MYSPLLVADYILAAAADELTPLQVNKLTYISHGFTLAMHDASLVRDSVEAWQYGPVFPMLYYALRQFGGNPIPHLTYCNTALSSSDRDNRRSFFGKVLGDKAPIIDMILETYGTLKASALIDLTHARGTPWSEYYRKNRRGVKIPNEAIKRHYEGIISGRS